MKPAAQIGLGDAVRRTGTDFALVERFEPSQDRGGMSGRCRLQSVLRQALEAYFRVPDGVTLADLVAQQQATEGVPLRWSPLPGIPGRVGCGQSFEAGGVSGGCGNGAASKHAPDVFIWKKSSPCWT